jgi:hypothetical protein
VWPELLKDRTMLSTGVGLVMVNRRPLVSYLSLVTDQGSLILRLQAMTPFMVDHQYESGEDHGEDNRV